MDLPDPTTSAAWDYDYGTQMKLQQRCRALQHSCNANSVLYHTAPAYLNKEGGRVQRACN